MTHSHTYVVSTPHQEVAYVLRAEAYKLQQEANLSELRAQSPKLFKDETLVAVLELLYSLGMSEIDAKVFLHDRKTAKEWLTSAIRMSDVECTKDRIRVKLLEVLLTELG